MTHDDESRRALALDTALDLMRHTGQIWSSEELITVARKVEHYLRDGFMPDKEVDK